jgi:hypothetical protein
MSPRFCSIYLKSFFCEYQMQDGRKSDARWAQQWRHS